MISTDFDDVILDLNSLLRKEIKKETGHDIGIRNSFYITIPDYTNEQTNSLIEHILEEKTIFGDPVPGSIQALAKIYKLTKKPIPIITAREPKLRNITETWLNMNVKNKFQYNVVFTNHKSKNMYFGENTKFFIDDHPYFVNEASKMLEHVFLMDQPWNRNITLRKNVSRIENIESVYIFLKHFLKFKDLK